MAFCTNCGNQVHIDAKFCGKCGHSVIGEKTNPNQNTIDNQSNIVNSPVSQPIQLTKDGLCYEYNRGKELEHFYSNSKRAKRYIKTIIYNIILIFIVSFLTVLFEIALVDYIDELEDKRIRITDDIEREIEIAEYFFNGCKIVIVILFLELIYHVIARELHKTTRLHLCENGIYGKTTFLLINKFDIPYSKIDNVTPHIKKGMFSDEFITIHTRTQDFNISIENVYAAANEIQNRIQK